MPAVPLCQAVLTKLDRVYCRIAEMNDKEHSVYGVFHCNDTELSAIQSSF